MDRRIDYFENCLQLWKGKRLAQAQSRRTHQRRILDENTGVGGQENNGSAGGLLDVRCGFDAIHSALKLHVHQNHLRTFLLCFLDGFLAGGGRADHVMTKTPKLHLQIGGHYLLIFDNQDFQVSALLSSSASASEVFGISGNVRSTIAPGPLGNSTLAWICLLRR